MRRTRRGRTILITAAALLACTLASSPPADARAADAEPCTPPPAVDTAKYFNTAGGQSWERVAAFFAENAVSFGEGVSDNRPVTLCREGCPLTPLWIQSEARTMCLSADSLRGQLRILGVIVGRGARTLPQYGFGPGNASDSVYLLVRSDIVYALFRNDSSLTQFAPHPAPEMPGWRFVYDSTTHSHADSVANYPRALWRNDDTVALAMRRPAEGPGEAIALQYAWMACISGCCQFQGTGGDPRSREPHPRPGLPGPPPGPPPARPRP